MAKHNTETHLERAWRFAKLLTSKRDIGGDALESVGDVAHAASCEVLMALYILARLPVCLK